MATLERIYTIPLGDVYDYIRNKRGKRAIKMIREFALRHMKAEESWISEGVNSAILRDGIQKPPRRIKVRIVKDDKNLAKVWLIGEEEKIKAAADAKKKSEEAKKKAAEEAAKKKAEAAKPAEKKAEPAQGAKPAEAKKPEPASPKPDEKKEPAKK